MLESIRKGAQTTTAKVLLGFLALTFVLFLGDFRGAVFNSQGIATVGGRSISENEFERALELEINALSQRAGRRITRSEARAFGLDRRVLSRLVSTAALDMEASALGLAVSERTAAETLMRDPAFQGLDGRFDRQAFSNILRSIGMRESDFIELRRTEEVRNQLTQSVLQAIVTPKPLVKAVHNWREETRIIEHFAIDAASAITVPEPDAAALKGTYETNKTQFMAPEYRQLHVLMASVEDVAKRIDVSDADIARSFDETKETYATPELRRVQQIPFKDKAAAEAARAAITSGRNFMTIAEEMGLKPTDLDLGLVNRKAIIDPKIADAAFALEKDKVSGVIEGRLTTVLLRVPEIIPGKQPTLAEVSDRVRGKLQREKAKADVKRMRDDVDDLRTAGRPDKDIAEAKALKLVDVAATDAQNKTTEGKPALEHPDAAAIIASGFDARSGVDRDPVDLADGGYAWVTTVGTTPPRQKPFEEVEAEVKVLHVSNERNRLLRDLAQKLADRLSAGESAEAVAAEVKAAASTSDPITRTTTPQGLSETAVRQAFALGEGKASHTESPERKGRTVFRVKTVKPAADPSKEQAAKLALEITQQVQIETIEAYISALQDQNTVTINEAALKRLLGDATTQ